jgi:hypothetical protein
LEKTDVRHQLEFQPEPAIFTRLPGLSEFRRLVGGGGEPGIPLTAAPPFHEEHRLTRFAQIGQYLIRLGVFDDRPQGE